MLACCGLRHKERLRSARRACMALVPPCASPEPGAGGRRTLQQVALAEEALTAARESLATIGSALGGAPALPAADKQEPAEMVG